MVRVAIICVYVSLMVGSALFQGGTAWYYSTREKWSSNTRDHAAMDYRLPAGGGTL